MSPALQQHLAETAAQPVHGAISAMASHVQSRHTGVHAVLAYGSAFRDSTPEDTLIDLYVLTADWHGVSRNPVSRAACWLVPPNVYYAECAFEGRTYRAKYAVLPLAEFAARCARAQGNPYVWARFAQPCRLLWMAHDAAKAQILQALAMAAETAWANATGLGPAASPDVAWETLFRNTYRTELRPEKDNRASLIVAANATHYRLIAEACQHTPPLRANWAWRRWQGKGLSVLRLLKAALTFQGGADYIAWKIERHSGVAVPVSDWQRRHPILAAITLLPQLLRRGALK